jgi:hypothetical protein
LGFQPLKTGCLATAALAATASAYVGWTLLSGRLLVQYYDRFLFEGAHLQDVVIARKEQQSRLPRLFVLAAALETAQQVMFTEQERAGDVLLEIARGVPVVNIFTGIIESLRSLHERHTWVRQS